MSEVEEYEFQLLQVKEQLIKEPENNELKILKDSLQELIQLCIPNDIKPTLKDDVKPTLKVVNSSSLFSKGQVVLAKYNDNYLKAIVQDILPNNLYSVQFVDSKFTADLSDLKVYKEITKKKNEKLDSRKKLFAVGEKEKRQSKEQEEKIVAEKQKSWMDFQKKAPSKGVTKLKAPSTREVRDQPYKKQRHIFDQS